MNAKQRKKEGMEKMVKDEEYIRFLKSIIACISHGDYFSAKELSHLELEKVKQRMKREERKK